MRIPWVPVALVLFAAFGAAAFAVHEMPGRGLLGLAALGSLWLMSLD